MLSRFNSTKERPFFMALALALGSGLVIGEAHAGGEYCPDDPTDFDSVHGSCSSICSVSTNTLTCTLTTDDDTNEMTIIEGYGTSGDDYAVFGRDNGSLFCCTFNDADYSGGITEFVANGTSADETLSFYWPLESGVPLDSCCSRTLEAEIYGGSGDDTIYGSTVDSADYSEWLYGDDGADWMYGYAGDDTLYGYAGADHIYGGSGEDYIEGGNGGDFLYGESDADEIHGQHGGDIVAGGSGADSLYGDQDADILCSGDDSNNYMSAGGTAGAPYDKIWGSATTDLTNHAWCINNNTEWCGNAYGHSCGSSYLSGKPPQCP